MTDAKELEEVLRRAEDAFSQGKWIDASSILRTALDRIQDKDMDLEGLHPEDISPRRKSMLRCHGAMRIKLGHCLRRMGRFEEGYEEFQGAERIGKVIRDFQVRSEALLGMGYFYWGRGEYERAKDLFNRSIEMAEKVHDPAIKGKAYMGLGNIALVTRDLEEGEKAFEKALTNLRLVEGTEIEQARVMHNQAFAMFKRGDRKRAVRAFKDCVRFAEAQGDLSTSGFAYSNLAHLCIETDDIQGAENNLEKAGHLIARTNDRFGLTLVQWVKGLLQAKKGDLEEAMKTYRNAKDAYESMDLPGQLLHLTVDYIPVFLEAGRKDEILDIIDGIKSTYQEKGFDHLLKKMETAERELVLDKKTD